MTNIQNRLQQEIDLVIAAYLNDREKIKSSIEAHGLPIRMDNFGSGNVWTFDDKTTLKA